MTLARILLLLLCTFYSSIGIEHRIDLDQCGTTTNCFVRESCILNKNNEKSLDMFSSSTTTLKDGNCDVVLQIRIFSSKKYHIMMQVNSTKKITPGVSFKQESEVFACAKDSLPKSHFYFKTALMGESRYEDKIVFCSFTLEAKKNDDVLISKLTSFTLKPSLVFQLESDPTQIEITWNGEASFFWMLTAKGCNPESLMPSDSSSEFLQVPIEDRYAFPPIKCDSPKSLILTRNQQSSILDVNQTLVCNKGLWEYQENSTSIPNTINPDQTVNVACGFRFCSLCTPMDSLSPLCPGCTAPVNGSDEGCITSSCPNNNEWKMENGDLWAGEIKCKKEIGVATSEKAYWYRQDEANEKVTKAACFNPAICWNHSQFKEFSTVKCGDVRCEDLLKFNGDSHINCTDGLVLKHSSAGIVHEANYATCDYSTKTFFDNNKTEIVVGSEVYCAEKEEKKEENGAASASVLPLEYIGGGIGLIVLLVVTAIIVFLCCRKRKEEENKKNAPQTVQLDGGSLETPSKASEKGSIVEDPASTVSSVKPTIKAPPKKPEPPITNSQLPKLPDATMSPPWLMRDRNQPKVNLTDSFFDDFDERPFGGNLHQIFAKLSEDDQKTIVANMTGYFTLSPTKKWKESWGSLRQFMVLLKCAFTSQMDCAKTWELIFRHVRMLDELIKKKFTKDNRDFGERLRKIMIKFALPIYKELGMTIHPNEHESDTRMRFMVVRMLLWADYMEVKMELSRLVDKPLDQLESPIRAVVLLFAVRYKSKTQEMKEQYWETALKNPKDVAADKFGTLRQHILFGLCAARDESKAGTDLEFKFMKEIIAEIYKMKPKPTSFIPIDQLWAFRGATEYNPRAAIGVFGHIKGFNGDADFKVLLHEAAKPHKCKSDEYEKMRDNWRHVILDMLDCMADCCISKKEFDSIAYQCGSFEMGLDNLVVTLPWNSGYYEERTSNLDRMIEDKKVPIVFDDAFKRIEDN